MRKRIIAKGIVQGVGFRPFVYMLAEKFSLKGFVFNDGEGVVIEIEGSQKNIELFYENFQINRPPLCRLDTLEFSDIAVQNSEKFEIIESKESQVATMLSADISMCDECRKEMFDKSNRRYLYPFINCTHCGPRYSIIRSLPYDRKNSAMRRFAMCPQCEAEYKDPTNRRYHAQPISCYECGPKLKIEHLLQKDKVDEIFFIETLCEHIKDAKTVALKGLGGFHLICDATNEEAVLNLRKQKYRPFKPFAIMFENIKAIERVCDITQEQRALILSKERPIVLVKKKSRSRSLAKLLAPNIDKLGVFLPYTPLHELLLKKLKKPIVATSANLSDEPIIRHQNELFAKLPLIVDISLTHDREILNACDDSVMSTVAGHNIMLRLARGFAPYSFTCKQKSRRKILALGANQKSTITLAFDGNIVLSPHIGDLSSLDAMEYFTRTVETFCGFYNFKPDTIVCDKHPKYETTLWAQKYIKEHTNVQLIQVQHHYAHTLACMAEYALQEEVLSFVFDGTGYGDSGMLWGGEVFLASPQNYSRVVHLEEFSLLGGERAVKEPRRVALSLLFESYDFDTIKRMKNKLVNSFTQEELQTFYLMHTRAINSPKSSSIGRLFDAVYALSGHLRTLAYEGESGMILETEANKYASNDSYTFVINDGVVEYKKLLQEILQEKEKKYIAIKFINALAKMILAITQMYPDKKVLLSGGVFQNSVLLEKTIALFQKHNIKYFIQEKTPINDGGISLGQAYHALHVKSKN